MMNTIKTFALSAVALFVLCLSAEAAKTKVTISPNCVTNTYNGKPWRSTDVVWEGGKRNPGDYVASYEFADRLTDAGKIVSSFAPDSVVIKNDQGYVVTGEYDITYGQGEIVVLPRAITVTAQSATNEYNGMIQGLTDAVVTETGTTKVWNFPANDGFVKTNFTGWGSFVTNMTGKAQLEFTKSEKAANYEITSVDGELVIKPANGVKVTLSTPKAKYNGTTSNLLVVAGMTVERCQKSDHVEVMLQTTNDVDVGSYKTFAWGAGAPRILHSGGKDVTYCYGPYVMDIIGEWMDIIPREVTLMSGSATKMYDGTPLTNHKVTVGKDGFVEGEGATYNVTGSQTNVGTSYNNFEYTLNANTSTNNYKIVPYLGALTVTNRWTTGAITSASITKEYDGGAVSTNGVDVTGVTGLAAGDEIVAWCIGSRTDAGICTNEVAYYITNKVAQVDVTDNYAKIATKPGLITVTARPITVQFFDATYTYDGTDHYPTNAVIEGSLVAGDEIWPSWSCNPVDAGVYACTNNGLFVANASTIWAAMNYDITRANTNALVTITKRPVTVTTGSAEKFYDQSNLENNKYKVGSGSFVPGDVEIPSVTTTGWIFYPGCSNNTFKINWTNPSREANYSVTTNLGTLLVKAKRIAYDLNGGDFTNEVTDANYWLRKQNDFQSYELPLNPMREGYVFAGWTNKVTGTYFKPEMKEVVARYYPASADVTVLDALWDRDPAYVGEPTVPAHSQYDDKIIRCSVVSSKATVGQRDVVVKDLPAEKPTDNYLRAVITIKAPKSTTEALSKEIKFNIDGYAVEPNTYSTLFSKPARLSEVKFHKADARETEDYYYVEWTAYVLPNQLNAALKENKPGEAFATTSLYCDWNSDGAFDTVYTVSFDADTCTIGEKVPAVATVKWIKGYNEKMTISKVDAAAWSNATQVTVWTNTVDLLDQEAYAFRYDLPRTGYKHTGWMPASTRGLVPMTKDVTLSTMELPIVAQWETNHYTTVFANDSTNVTHKYAISQEYLDNNPTNNWTVEDLHTDLPGAMPYIKDAFISKYYTVNGWHYGSPTGAIWCSINRKLLVTNGLAATSGTLTFYPSRVEKSWTVDYDLTNGFLRINQPGSPYVALANNITAYTVSTNNGQKIAMADASCFGCKFEGWTPSAVIDPLAGFNMTFTAKWSEYQALVSNKVNGTFAYYTDVAEAVAAVTNSGTTIAFLDAKGDGINNPCQIKIGDNLKDITINFCALDYTNKVGDAAILIGTNSEVAVMSVPGYIGEGALPSNASLIQQGGGNAVKVGEGSTFTLDDAAVAIDVVAGENKTVAKIAEEYEKIANWKFQYEDAQWWIGTNTGYVTGFGATNFLAKFVTVSNDVHWTQDYSWSKPYGGVAYLTDRNDDSKFITLTNAQHALTYVGKITAQAKIKEALYKVAKARYEEVQLENCAAIYAPSNATLVLKKGKIGAKAYGEKNKCASIDWVGHREYLDYTTNNLVFATKPVQQCGKMADQANLGFDSQVAAGCIWAMNPSWLTRDEFPYSVAEVTQPDVMDARVEVASEVSVGYISGGIINEGFLADLPKMLRENKSSFATNAMWKSTSLAYCRPWMPIDEAIALADSWTNGVREAETVAPNGTMIGTNATLVGTLFVSEYESGRYVTNRTVLVKSPSAVVGTNETVVGCYPTNGSYYHPPATDEFGLRIANDTHELIPQLVGTLETGVATNIALGLDWDGAAGSNLNTVVYTLNYSGKDVVISNCWAATPYQVFPNIGKITYKDEKGLIDTNALRSTYTILDTTEEGGLALEPVVGGIYTNGQNKAYRFDGWYSDYEYENLVTNLVHTTGAGDDATNVWLNAKYTKLVWGIGTDPRASFADLQEAVDALKDGGFIKFFGSNKDAHVRKPVTAKGDKTYTIDLGGKNFTASSKFKGGDYIFEIAGVDVTITNGSIGTTNPKIVHKEETPRVGGIRASEEAKVTLKDNLTIDTYKTMVCADDGSLVTVDGAYLKNQHFEAGVKALDEATLVFTNLNKSLEIMYRNTVFASNAEFRVSTTAMNCEQVLVDGIKTNVTAITAMDGAEVYLDSTTAITNGGDAPTILAKNAYVEVNKRVNIANKNGNVIVAEPMFDGDKVLADKAGIKLNGGGIEAMNAGAAVLLYAGKLDAPIGSAVAATTRQSTIVIDNLYGVLKPEDITLWGGKFKTITGEALLSRNSGAGDRLEGFMDCAYEAGVKGALFSTGVRKAYCAEGYIPCEDDEVVETAEEEAEFWHFIKTIPYAISYDLNGGAWKQGTDMPYSSYDVEMSMNNYEDICLTNNTPIKSNYYFGGWYDNAALEGKPVSYIPVGTTGNLAFFAMWSDNKYMVKGDNQGTDGYPRYIWTEETGWIGRFWSEEVTPSKPLTIKAPAARSGFQFLYYEDDVTGHKYLPGQTYEIGDFKFDDKAVCNVHGVWESDMGVMDDKGNRYVTLEDAITNAATTAGTTLHIVGKGEYYHLDRTIVIDKDITVDLSAKKLDMNEGFEGDALFVITNAEAYVVNGTLMSAGETNAIKVLDKDGAAVPVIDADWLLKFGTELSAEYIADGYMCQKVADESGLYEIVAVVKNLTFDAGKVPAREGFVVALNNEDTTFTCVSDPIAINDATLTAYDFKGWFDGETTITDGWFVPAGVTKDVTLTAQWSPTVYDIVYETEGGAFIDAVKKTYTCEDEAFTLAEPMRPGYTFKGWRVNGATEAVKAYTVVPLAMAGNEFGTLTAVAVWEANCYTITFDTLGGKAISDLKYNESLAEQGVIAIPEAEKVGCKFVKWVDEQGQTVKTGVITECFSAKLTAVYERSLWTDGNVIGGNPADGRGKTFNGNVTYTGSILDKGSKSVGKVTVTAGKPSTKGLVTITMTTSTILGEGKAYTLKNTTVDVSKGVQDVELTNSAKDKAVVRISDNGVKGTFGDYTIVASADRFATNVTKIPAATLAYLQGNWTVGFQSKDACHGATTLKLTVAAKGKVTVSGNLGDGTAVSTTSQLVYGDGVCVCPVVINAYTGKKGGFAFDLWFGTTGVGDNVKDEIEITSLSDLIDAEGNVLCEAKNVLWAVQRVAENVTRDAYVFKVNLADFDLPEGYELLNYSGEVSIEANVQTGKLTVPATTTVSINATTGAVTWKNPDCENKLGLALTYTKSTGALTGSIKVYAKVQNATTGKWSLKTYTAKVYGVMSMVGEYGLCTATEKTIGSAPAELKSAELD